MSANRIIRFRLKQKFDGGFTLTEGLVVIVVAGILAAVTVARFSSSDSNNLKSAADSIVNDIAYAQEIAIQQNRGTKVTFSYAGTPVPNPGATKGKKKGWGRGRGRSGGFKSGGAAGDANTYALEYQSGGFIKNPTGLDDFIVDLGYEVSITSANLILKFDSAGRLSVVGYDWPSGDTFVICCTLNSAVDVVISKHTGKAWVDE